MPQPKQIRLAINLLASGRHNASWKTLDDPAGLPTDIDVFLRIARTAERGLLDGIFLADNYAGLNRGVAQAPVPGPGSVACSSPRWPRTRIHIGLVSTVPALYANPATVAREIASLDHVSKGRGAWNIITSQHDAHSGDLRPGQRPCRSRPSTTRPTSSSTIVTQLWESLPPEAIVADAAALRLHRPGPAPAGRFPG